MVPYLDVQHLSKSFGALTLFRDISFSIGEGQKVGLIAKNGTGKSTLLSILSGKEGYDSGSIVFRRDLKVGMLDQSPKFDPDESVLDACFNHQGEDEKVLKAKQVLTQLKIRDLTQRMGELSGGQQKRVALANVLLTEPDLLILDEPTNHLDLEMIEWLEGYLARGNKTLLMVTHDRFFLDRVPRGTPPTTTALKGPNSKRSCQQNSRLASHVSRQQLGRETRDERREGIT